MRTLQEGDTENSIITMIMTNSGRKLIWPMIASTKSNDDDNTDDDVDAADETLSKMNDGKARHCRLDSKLSETFSLMRAGQKQEDLGQWIHDPPGLPVTVGPREMNKPVLSVLFHTDALSVEALRPHWEHLLDSSSETSIFSTPEWLLSWWRAYRVGGELWCLSFCEQDGTVVGIAPLFVSRTNRILGRALRRVSFIGAGSTDSDGLNFVIRPGYAEACVDSFLAWIATRQDWDICSLDTLPQNSRVAQLIRGRLASLSWPHDLAYVPHWYVPLPATWKLYLESLSPEFRPLLTRYPRRLESRNSCRVLRCESSADLQQYLPVLFNLHQRRRRQVGDEGAFASTGRRRFYEIMGAEFLRRGWLEFWVLEVNGAAVAANFCFRYRRTVYLLQEGFDPEYAKDRVGYALRSKMLQSFIDQGMETYDFLGGSEPYKQKFASKQDAYLTVSFAKPRTLGELSLRAHQCRNGIREWLRTKLPDAVVSRIQTARARKRQMKREQAKSD
jgi:CelD/BcsL family acetyltransferase involved in cellulose biosynthesis